jgi:hypothetical protein
LHVPISILQAGDQWFHGPRIPQPAQRNGSVLSYEPILILQRGDQRLHGPRVAQYTQRIGSVASQERILILQPSDLILNVVSQYAIGGPSEQ